MRKSRPDATEESEIVVKEGRTEGYKEARFFCVSHNSFEGENSDRHPTQPTHKETFHREWDTQSDSRVCFGRSYSLRRRLRGRDPTSWSTSTVESRDRPLLRHEDLTGNLLKLPLGVYVRHSGCPTVTTGSQGTDPFLPFGKTDPNTGEVGGESRLRQASGVGSAL